MPDDMPHDIDCSRGPHCECDPPEADEYDEPNDGYDPDVIYELAANIEMAKAFQPSRASEIAAQLAAARLAEDACINPNDCCGWCQADETEKNVRQRMAELAAQDIDTSNVPDYEPASPRYAVAYWLASLIGALTSAELGASDCLDDADELIGELRNCGLDIVRMDTDVVRDWRQGVCFDPECRGGWIWVDIDDGETIRQRCPRCEAS